ncbi:hypothetical protein Tco_0385974 [Tanacetum coccineum]
MSAVICRYPIQSVHSEARSGSIDPSDGSLSREADPKLLGAGTTSSSVWTPPSLPIPAPPTSRRADIPEADTPPRKRLLLTTPRPGCEIGESSAAAAARQPGPTIETRLLDTERRIMTALELVNRRVSYQVDVCTRESVEFFSTNVTMLRTDLKLVRAEIDAYCRRERLLGREYSGPVRTWLGLKPTAGH